MVNQSRNVDFLHRASYRLQALLSQKTTKVNSQAWLIVYLDVITLLLAMFILLVNQPQQVFLVEQPELQKDQLQQEPVNVPVSTLTDDQSDQLAQSKKSAPEFQTNIAEKIQQQLEALQSDDLVVEIEPGTVNLQLPEAILFETGESLLLPVADELLKKITPILQQYNFPVSVEGHTDNVPIYSAQFPSNWELSSARASMVIRKLGELGVPFNRLKAIGYADTVPIESNETIDGRRSNRRVNIIIHAEPE